MSFGHRSKNLSMLGEDLLYSPSPSLSQGHSENQQDVLGGKYWRRHFYIDPLMHIVNEYEKSIL